MKILKVFTAFIFAFLFIFQGAFAYVNVNGYFRSDGTYVRPHVRSNPNGLKFDNYGWTPSQGLYNDTYGTRDEYWDTPTYLTDPDYYEGKTLYELGTGSSSTYTNNITSTTQCVDTVNGYLGSDNICYCNIGYEWSDMLYKCVESSNSGCPENSYLYADDNCYCNSGYYWDDDLYACAELNYLDDDEWFDDFMIRLKESIGDLKEGSNDVSKYWFNKAGESILDLIDRISADQDSYYHGDGSIKLNKNKINSFMNDIGRSLSLGTIREDF